MRKNSRHSRRSQLYKSTLSFYRKIQPWLIWLLGAGFFFCEYFARVSPSVTAAQLMAYFQVGALAIGNLSAFFYYPYIAMQIPVGTLLDRFGPRRVLTLMAFLCGLACFSFAYVYNIHVAQLSRALMGFSAAFAFVGALKIATIWFEPRFLGLLAGLTQGMGMLGAAVGEGLFAMIIAVIGWRETIALIGVILVVFAILIGLIVRDKRPTLLGSHWTSETSRLGILEGLMVVFRNRNSWVNVLYVGLLYAPTACFAELWGPSYLQRVYGIDPELAAWAVSVIFLGWAIGGPLVGWASDRMRLRRPIMFASSFLSLILLSAILYMKSVSIYLLFCLLFLYGVSNTGVAIAYAVAGELNPLAVSGVSIAFANMSSIAIGALLQPGIGWMIQRNWDGLIINGGPYYSISDYRHAMIILPFCLAAAFVFVFFIKETHCRRRE